MERLHYLLDTISMLQLLPLKRETQCITPKTANMLKLKVRQIINTTTVLKHSSQECTARNRQTTKAGIKCGVK